MDTLFRIGLIAVALLFSCTAIAQDAPPNDGTEIVVTGNRSTDREIADFVNSLIVTPTSGQLSRFHWAVCPLAAGLPPSQKQAIAQRMRDVAKAADMGVSGTDCTPNVLVIVTPDKRALMQGLSQRYPAYFSGLPKAERRRLIASSELAVAWHLKGPPLNADGHAMAYDSVSGTYINRTTRPPSRIGFASRPTFAVAIVVVEQAALEGLTTTQLADYAAMRTFVRTEPGGLAGSSAPTILKVLDTPMGGTTPLSLTHWDLGVLRGLYSSNPNLSAAAQRSQIRREVRGDLKKAEDLSQ